MLVYVTPPSVEIWTKPKSQPSSSFQSASNVRSAADGHLLHDRLVAVVAEARVERGLPVWPSGGFAALVH
jgi:hypothetical protein